MSGDVQPRKRKDKKRKKDDLGVEEPRGTAAALGEGDVFIHSQHDHGTGGHWCAKIIFFSLLVVLITLVGLIILENRGLSELEANSVESRYSGVLEGWLEDAPDDDHHDEHTLELNHPDDDEDDHGHDDDNEELEQDQEDEHEDEDENEDGHDEEDELDQSDNEDDDDEESNEQQDIADSQEENDEDEDEHDEEDEEDTEVEVERIEKEIDLEPISTELPALPEDDDDDDNDKSEEQSTEEEAQEKEDDDDGVAPEDLDDDFLEDDTDEPPIERITAPVGKPLVEVEEEDSLETPPDTLAEEEEYEKQQDEKKREEEKSSHMWLKLTVGGALLVATHALVRRATAPRDSPTDEERSEREETPLINRRMTLIPDEPIPVPKISTQSYAPPVPQEEIFQRVPVRTQQTSPPQEEEYEDDEIKQIEDEEIEVLPSPQDTEDKELYSDEEVEEEEDIEVKKEVPKLSASKPEEKVVEPEPDPDDEDPDDVEIIDDEQLEEEDEEEDDEEEISDVDDAELLSRLEAKYGRLPEPERPGQKPKDGGNSIEDEWPGEPSDAFWRQELDSAEDDLRRGSWSSAAARASSAELWGSARARWLLAQAADMQAEAERDNRQLGRAIAAYLELLKMHEQLPDDKLRQVAARALDRIMFRGNYLSAEPVYKLLIRRFPDEVAYRNNLTISFLMANRADLAEEILKETLQKWPNDRVALAHYGFVLKTLRNRLEEAVEAFQKALEGDSGPANEPRFYYHLGDALLLLGRPAEAHEVHKRGAKLGHFLSPAQRSLYNVPQLKSQAWWNVEETPYAKLAHALEKNWKDILKEGEAAKALYEKEKEGLKERGDWSQLDLFARGQEIPNRCKNAPVTCSIVRSEPAAVGCRRGQIKFSAMVPGTHVRPHVGPTNCRLRMHLALSNTKNTFIRVDQTVRQWQTGKVLMFDDSFEHEVWHNGTGTRLVLIVDVWHPDLTPRQRRSLPAI